MDMCIPEAGKYMDRAAVAHRHTSCRRAPSIPQRREEPCEPPVPNGNSGITTDRLHYVNTTSDKDFRATVCAQASFVRHALPKGPSLSGQRCHAGWLVLVVSK